MGYTTEFEGVIVLSRPLTFAEAKELLDINVGHKDPVFPTGTKINGFMQWVPTEDLHSIMWDQQEKFYNYIEWLKWLCVWLSVRGIVANGTLIWSGDNTGDFGSLCVKDNQLIINRTPEVSPTSDRPITLETLGKIALEAMTAKEGKK